MQGQVLLTVEPSPQCLTLSQSPFMNSLVCILFSPLSQFCEEKPSLDLHGLLYAQLLSSESGQMSKNWNKEKIGMLNFYSEMIENCLLGDLYSQITQGMHGFFFFQNYATVKYHNV